MAKLDIKTHPWNLFRWNGGIPTQNGQVFLQIVRLVALSIAAAVALDRGQLVVDDVEVVFGAHFHFVQQLVDFLVQTGRGGSLGRVIAPAVHHYFIQRIGTLHWLKMRVKNLHPLTLKKLAPIFSPVEVEFLPQSFQ